MSTVLFLQFYKFLSKHRDVYRRNKELKYTRYDMQNKDVFLDDERFGIEFMYSINRGKRKTHMCSQSRRPTNT